MTVSNNNEKVFTAFKELGVLPTCTCLTKTPDPDYHNKGCPVWLVDRLTSLAGESKVLLDLLWHPSLEADENIVQPLQDAYNKIFND